MSFLQVSAESEVGMRKGSGGSHNGFCAICWDWIPIEDTALIKGCEHAYCVNCILRWATYNKTPSCPQCKYPFESLNVHRSLDGCIHDYMFEESVCLLLRASWFVPVRIDDKKEAPEDVDDYYQYEDEDVADLDDRYYMSSSRNIHIGNRRWGGNGYVRAGRKEARTVNSQSPPDSHAGPSQGLKKSEAVTGRRAKRALKREAADKLAAAKH